jgi:hypothetical protein
MALQHHTAPQDGVCFPALGLCCTFKRLVPAWPSHLLCGSYRLPTSTLYYIIARNSMPRAALPRLLLRPYATGFTNGPFSVPQRPCTAFFPLSPPKSASDGLHSRKDSLVLAPGLSIFTLPYRLGALQIVLRAPSISLLSSPTFLSGLIKTMWQSQSDFWKIHLDVIHAISMQTSKTLSRTPIAINSKPTCSTTDPLFKPGSNEPSKPTRPPPSLPTEVLLVSPPMLAVKCPPIGTITHFFTNPHPNPNPLLHLQPTDPNE